MPEPVLVTLSWGALEHAKKEAQMREKWAAEHPNAWNHRDWVGGGDDKFLSHFQGCASELATGVYTNRYPTVLGACGDLFSPDMGGPTPYEVKFSKYASARLPVRAKDQRHPEMPIVLTTGGDTDYLLRGWIFIWEAEGLVGGETEDPNGYGVPAYFVPARLLRPMPELREYLWQREGELYGLKQQICSCPFALEYPALHDAVAGQPALNQRKVD